MAKLRIAPVILALGLVFAACGGGDDGGSASNDTSDTTAASGAEAGAKVALKDLKFNPDEISVKKGDTVTWEWKENVLHNVTGEGFKSDNISEGTFEHTFDKAGTFDYQC